MPPGKPSLLGDVLPKRRTSVSDKKRGAGPRDSKESPENLLCGDGKTIHHEMLVKAAVLSLLKYFFSLFGCAGS